MYKVNNSRGNLDMPSFVFKTNCQRMDIAIKINKDGDHFLKEEYCYFDRKVKAMQKVRHLNSEHLSSATKETNSLSCHGS